MNQTEQEHIRDLYFVVFGDEEGQEVSKLAEDLLALPDTISHSAIRDEKIVGNVLFTPFEFEEYPEARCFLLAPLGVLPNYQRQGIGKELIETGIAHLKSIGADAVFVLGVPSYYPHYGFTPTDKQTPYPELLTLPKAWMMLELNKGATDHLGGKTAAVAPFMNPHDWDTSGRE